MDESPLDGLLDTKDVAKLLRVCPRTVQKLTYEGKLPHFYVGRQVRYDKEAVLQHVRKGGG